MSAQTITKRISNLDLETKQGIEQARLILGPYVHEKARLDLINTTNKLEKTADPVERYPLVEEMEKAYKAIANAQQTIDEALKPLPPLKSLPAREEVDAYEMEFLIDAWMPADCLTILTGAGGIGKSYLSLQYICALAMGVDANPYALMPDKEITANDAKQIQVVIASYEETELEVGKRIRRICDTLKWPCYETLSKQIHYVDLQGLGPAWGVATGDHLALRSKMLPIGEYLLSESQKCGARLLVLDPSAAVYGGSDIARESVREFTSAISAWCREAGCATLLIAHPPKSGDDYAGSTDWLGSCRAMWTLQKKERKEADKTVKNWYQLTNITKNYAPPQAPIYLRKIVQDSYYTPIWTPCMDQKEAEKFYKEYHESFGNTPSITVKELPPDTPQEENDESEEKQIFPKF